MHFTAIIRKVGLVVALGFALCVPANAEDLQGIAAVIQAKAAYLLALAQSKLDAAQADLAEAQAGYQNVKAEQLQQLIIILQHEYDRVLQEESDVQRQVDELKLRASQTNPLKLGHVDASVASALNFFIAQVLPGDVITKNLFNKVAPLGAEENFVVNDEEDGIDRPLVAFAGGNIGQLLKFVEDHDFSFVPWSPGHEAVMDFIAAVAKSAQDKIDEYHRYMDGIRSGTLPVWGLPQS